MSEAALLEVEDLAAGYLPGRPAISDVEFAASAEQIVAVLGPNGGGKTTLLRALLGLTGWNRGRIRVHSEISYVPQTERSRLDFPVTAFDVAVMGTYPSTPAYRRVGRTQRRAALAALARVALEDQAGMRFGELSGGQRQRVLIARALARAADVLLLDEPLSGVDEPSSRRILAILRELREEGRTMLVATHDIRQAREFDAVLCLNGRQIAFGGPDEVLSPSVLERTYGGELIPLDGTGRAILVDHHSH